MPKIRLDGFNSGIGFVEKNDVQLGSVQGIVVPADMDRCLIEDVFLAEVSHQPEAGFAHKADMTQVGGRFA